MAGMKMLVVSNRVINNAQWFSGLEQLEHYLKTRDNIETLLFAFWSWRVPSILLNKYRCYGMHTGYLTEGKGKGGSPIDNLQRLGVRWAQLNVFEMNEGFDDGRVILACPIRVDVPKEQVIQDIDCKLESIIAYLTEKRPEIPERFQRIKP
jgi:hypothetical protein